MGTTWVKGHHWKAQRDALPDPNPFGLCLCGCGEPTGVARQTNTDRHMVKGKHVRFRPGHANRLMRGEQTSSWKGGRIITDQGYAKVRVDGGYVYEHRAVMERILGRALTASEQVHHVNGVKDDNRPENLELWVRSQPNGVRQGDVLHCPTCTCHTQ